MFEKVRAILAEQLNVKADKIKPESKIVEDLGADSLDVVEMLMSVEDKFSVSVSDEEAVNLKTVGDIVKLLETKIEK
jgi:acyl carrier protein